MEVEWMDASKGMDGWKEMDGRLPRRIDGWNGRTNESEDGRIRITICIGSIICSSSSSIDKERRNHPPRSSLKDLAQQAAAAATTAAASRAAEEEEEESITNLTIDEAVESDAHGPDIGRLQKQETHHPSLQRCINN